MTRWRGLDDVLDAAVARGAVPGAVAVVTGRDGTVHEAVAGRVHAGGGEPVTTDTMFRLASMTKALASVAALQLVERGALDLDQEVASVLPAFADLPVLDGFDGDTPRLRAPARQATVRELLNHTAGLGYVWANADLLRYHELTGLPNVLAGQKGGLAAPLVADPGTRWEYGTSTDWLGQVIEAVSALDLAEYLREHVFLPLDMADATFAPTAEQRARLMPVHHRMPDGTLVAGEFDLPPEPELWSGGHGAHGTGRDYARFMAAVLRGGELDGARILAAETVELLFRDSLGGLPLPERIEMAMPELSNDIVAPPVRQGWALGLHVTLEDLPGMRRAGTGDWAGLFNTYYWIDPASGVAGALLTQILPFYDDGVLETAMAAEQHVYATLAAQTGSAAGRNAAPARRDGAPR